MKEFFEKNKVFISGLIGAIIYAIVQIDSTNGLQLKDLVMPAIVAASAYFANNLRGQWVTIIGIAFSVLIGILQAKQSGSHWTFDAKTVQLVLAQIAVLFFGSVAPPAKSLGYEKSQPIMKAKAEGEAIQARIEETPPPQV